MEFKIFSRIAEIEQSAWAQIVNPDFPFQDHAFLLALERGGCLGEERGWVPHYLTAWEESELLGAILLYEKEDSYGEYIFDWEWASLVESARRPYYPKLISAVPFTPATGPKVLVKSGADFENVQSALIQESRNLALQLNMHSLHALFIEAKEQTIFEKQGFILRETHQFHWQNKDYRDFPDFLAEFTRKKRQNILRERSAILNQNLQINCFTGKQLLSEHAEFMVKFYLHTVEKNGAHAYLTREFFKEIFETFAESVILFLAFSGKECVAGSLFFLKGKALFGRYWGAKSEFANLHFELCYYQGIELAIARKLERFEAGAQGPHKINRGFLPAYTYSAHWFSDSRIQQMVAQLVNHEKSQLRRGFEAFKARSPFRKACCP